jgi:hypothetical protein
VELEEAGRIHEAIRVYRNLGKRRWQIHWLRVAARLGEPDAPVALREMIHA